MRLVSTHLDQTVSFTHTGATKTGVMGSIGVINSREGNEVTVDSQFSKRKLAFIRHLILWSKQVSCARLSTGDMTTSFAGTIILMWRRERNSKNKNIKKKREEVEENISIKRANEIHLVLCDEAAKEMLTINGAIR